MYAGGLSYFSSGSVGSGLCGAVWPDAIGSTDSKARQMKKLVFDTIKTPQVKRGKRISEHTRGVHQIFQRKLRAWQRSRYARSSSEKLVQHLSKGRFIENAHAELFRFLELAAWPRR